MSFRYEAVIARCKPVAALAGRAAVPRCFRRSRSRRSCRLARRRHLCGDAHPQSGNRRSDTRHRRAGAAFFARRHPDRSAACTLAGSDEQRCLRQPVAGRERFPPKAAGGEALNEALRGFRNDWLAAADRRCQAGEVDAGEVVLVGGTVAKFVGEIRRAADRRPLIVDCLEPSSAAAAGSEAGP